MTINTGTGGFPIDGELHAYDVGSTLGDEKPKKKWDAGDIKVDQASEDLSAGTKRTLASYLSKTTLGLTPSSPSPVANSFPVIHLDPNKDPSTLSLTDEKGYPSRFTSPADQPQFKGDLGSGLSSDAADLKILRGRQQTEGVTVDGNTLLPDATPTTGQGVPQAGSVNVTQLNDTSPIKPYTDGLLAQNEYGSSSPYASQQISVPLRPPEQVGVTAYNPLGPQDLPKKKLQVSAKKMIDSTSRGESPMPVGNYYTPYDLTTVPSVIAAEYIPDTQEVSLTDKATGYPSPLSETNNGSKFVDRNLISGRSAAATPERLSQFIRGRAPGLANASTVNLAVAYNGNRLLRDATDDVQKGTVSNPSAIGGQLPALNMKALNPDSPINRYYGDSSPSEISNSVIFNRFNPTTNFETYSRGDGTSADQLRRPQFALPRQYALGKSVAPTDQVRSVSYGRLAQLGSALSIRGGSELNSFDPGNNPTDGTAQAAALLPGLTQLGVERINRNNLNAEDVLRDLTGDEIDEGTLIDPAKLSWGTLNNVQDQFSGVSNFGMQLLAVALLAALTVVFTTLSVIVTVLGGTGTSDSSTVDSLGRRPYGMSKADSSDGVDYSTVAGLLSALFTGKFNLWQYLGMNSTLFKFEKAYMVGAQTFFGISKPGTTVPTMAAAIATEGALSVIKSPGYYSVMSRAVTRSFLLIGDSFSGLVKAFGTGAVAGIKQLFETIDVLRNSKFMRVLNIFAQMGDRKLLNDSRAEENREDLQSIGRGTRFKSELDLIPNGPFRSRLDVGDSSVFNAKELGWASFRAADMFVMPENLFNFMNSKTASDLGRPSMLPTVLANPPGNKDFGGLRNSVYDVSYSGRISTEAREDMEIVLDAEYVPFFIHDVRTNEIVSFHAFLSSLSDDYSASYDSIDGFGRVEPIRTYKGTSRKISFSFYLAATSKKDFDSMWLKINKLTTLVYPQFTDGRIMVNKERGDAFYAPFSQTIGAAPLVRVRIGDLIRSNYSKFNLARIFGYTYPGSQFDGVTSPTTPSEEQNESIKAETQRVARKFYTVGNMFTTNSALSRPAPTNRISGFLGGEPTQTLSDLKLPAGFVLKITNELEDDMFECQVVEATGEDKPIEKNEEGLLNAFTTTVQRYLTLNQFKGDGGDDVNIFEKYFIFKLKDLTPAPSTEKKIMTEVMNSQTYANYDKKALEFMSDDPAKGNAVVRSFRSSGGTGLAGFIESLNFNWMDRTTWETEGDTAGSRGYGRRAPKLCQVTVSFAPIHDLTPGLDHLGSNRAPIYPIGPLATPRLKRKR